MRDATERALNIGVVGLGMAASAMIGSISAHPHVRFVAAADTHADLRDRFAEDFGATPYGSVDALCADPAVEVVYIATPHQFHREHTLVAARHGKHIIQEKPLALSLEDCDAIIDAVSAARVHMIIGHTQSYAPAIRTMRAVIARGNLGPLSMINTWQYNDFLYRPRRPEELDTSRGAASCSINWRTMSTRCACSAEDCSVLCGRTLGFSIRSRQPRAVAPPLWTSRTAARHRWSTAGTTSSILASFTPG
jgi:hypothetical protein